MLNIKTLAIRVLAIRVLTIGVLTTRVLAIGKMVSRLLLEVTFFLFVAIVGFFIVILVLLLHVV